MKKFKRTLAVFTALLMALPLLWAMPTAVLAANPTNYAVLKVDSSCGVTPTALKVQVGSILDGCSVYQISGYDIYVDLTPKEHLGNTNNQTFQLPYANTLWEIDGTVDSIWGNGNWSMNEGHYALLHNLGNEFYYKFKATPKHEFWLKFDANGGTGAPPDQYYSTASQYESSHTFVIPNQIPTRAGYTFQGWSKTRDGEATYQPGGSVFISEFGDEGTTVTLYAVWQDDTPPATEPPTPEPTTYTVTYHRNDGTSGSDEIFQEQNFVPYGTHLYKPDDPVWEGHTFVGWSRDRDGTNPWNFETDVVTGDTDLYAQWQSNMPDKPTPGVVQHIRESSIVATECSRQGNDHPRFSTELYDNSFTIGDVEGNATDGYTCLITVNPERYVAQYNQWFHDDYGTVDHVYDENADNVATFTMDWDAENSQWVYNGDTTGFIVHFFVICPETYTVTFEPGGGRPLEGQQHPEEPPKTEGQQFTLPPCPYENPNHTFAGWEYGDTIYQPGDVFTMPAEDVVFTATWEPIATSADILGTITVVNPRANKTYDAYRVFDLTYSCDVPGQPPTSYAYSIESDSPWFNVVQTYANETTHGLKLTQSAADSNHYIVEFAPEANSIPGYGAFDPVDFAAYLRDHRPTNAVRVAYRNAGPTPTGSIKLTTDGNAPGQTTDGDNYHVPLGYYFVDTGTGTFCGLDSADPDAYIYDKYEVPGWDTQSGSNDLGKVVAAKDPYATPDPGSWGKTSDATIGSKAWFKIMAHVPAYEYGHQIDQYTFTDTLGNGFTYDTGSLKITLYCGLDENGVPIANPSTVLYDSVANPTHPSAQGVTVTFNGNTITVKLQLTGENAIDLDGEDGEENYYPDAHIVIEYTAHVDQDAVHDNVNTAKMNWSWAASNPVPTQPPEPTPEPGQTTPPSIPTTPAIPADVQTDTYVYGFPFNKTIKDSNQYLSGAEFELYSDADCTQLINLVVDNELPEGAPTPTSEWKYYRVADATETAASVKIEAGRAVIWGLAPGTYYLLETKAPDGYNPLADPFPITICTGDDPTTTDVTEVKNVGDNGYVSTDTFNVENAAGAELPGVGGIGTTIFYIVGALLMIAAAVLLTVRKKMSVQE